MKLVSKTACAVVFKRGAAATSRLTTPVKRDMYFGYEQYASVVPSTVTDHTNHQETMSRSLPGAQYNGTRLFTRSPTKMLCQVARVDDIELEESRWRHERVRP